MAYLTATKDGEFVSFMSAKEADIKSLKIYFQPKQAGEGDSGPDNVRDIVGWNSVSLWQTGNNMVEFKNYQSNQEDIPAHVWMKQNNSIAYSAYIDNTNGTSASKLGIRTYKNGKKVITITSVATVAAGEKKRLTLGVIPIAYGDFDTIRFMVSGYPVVLDKQATYVVPGVYNKDDCYSYRGQTINVPFDKTIYGGYIDLISGDLVQKYTCLTIDGNTPMALAYNSKQEQSTRFYVSTHLAEDDSMHDLDKPCYVNIAQYGSSFDGVFRYYRQGNAEFNIYVPTSLTGITMYDDDETILQKGHAYFAEHPVQYVFAMKEPIIHKINPVQLKTLVGQNYIWSDAYRVEVEYDVSEPKMITDLKRRIMADTPSFKELRSWEGDSFETNLSAPLKQCEVWYRPKQEFGGPRFAEYKYAWIGGAGINLFDPNTDKHYYITDNNEIVYDDKALCVEIIALPNEPYTLTVVKKNMVDATTRFGLAACDSENNILKHDYYITWNYTNQTYNFVTPENTVKVIAFVEKSTIIDKIQLEQGTGSNISQGLYPYSNVCEIEGLTEISFYRNGKNLYDKSRVRAHGHSDWDVIMDGNKAQASANDYSRWTLVLPCEINDTYAWLPNCYEVGFLDNNKNVLQWVSGWDHDSAKVPYDPYEAKYIYLSWYDADINTAEQADARHDTIFLTKDVDKVTQDDFEPFDGQMVRAHWEDTPGIVYGGTVDIAKKLLVKEYERYDLTQLDYSQISIGRKVTTISASLGNILSRGTMYCNIFRVTEDPDVSEIEGIDWSNNKLDIVIRNDRNIKSIEEFVAWLKSLETTPVIVARLPTPVSYSIQTDGTLIARKGHNIISAELWSEYKSVNKQYWTH